MNQMPGTAATNEFTQSTKEAPIGAHPGSKQETLTAVGGQTTYLTYCNIFKTCDYIPMEVHCSNLLWSEKQTMKQVDTTFVLLVKLLSW